MLGKRDKSIDFSNLDLITQDLQSGYKRGSDLYLKTINAISTKLNTYHRGAITRIDIAELRDQIGHLLYYQLKNVDQAVPFDIEHVPPMLSHFRNPTVLVLRRIRKYLMAAHRKILTRLEEDQARERRLNFTTFDVSQTIKNGLGEMQRYETIAGLTKSVSRKLDVYTKALHVPAQAQSDFAVLKRILDDPHHLRHPSAMTWLDSSSYHGNRKVLNKLIGDGLKLLDKKALDIFTAMEKASGIPFDRDTSKIDPSFNWYSLGTPLRRGEDFVRIFENEEVIENKIRHLTFFMVRATWSADHYRDLVEKLQPSERDYQDNCTKLARIYMEIEDKIRQSTSPLSEAQTAIESDFKAGSLTDKEVEKAKAWVLENKVALQALKLEIFNTLTRFKSNYPDMALPEALELLMEPEPVGDGEAARSGIPTISILDLHRELENLDQAMNLPDGSLLLRLCQFRDKIQERIDKMNGVDFQRSVRSACADFEEYQKKLFEFDRAETRLEEIRLQCELHILDCYRNISYMGVEEQALEVAFDLVVDRMLLGIKKLDYDVIDANQLKDRFDNALMLENREALLHLDQLLHEVHSIPRQDQLLHALADWENTLGKKEFEAKQEYILENEIQLQKLVDDVRAELRERIADADFKPRRLRFEVFSLADCYAGNLNSLLKGLLRMAPQVASEQEGERLIANLQAIESQTIEAQRITKPNGEAYEKLKELERLNLLPDEIIAQLYGDLDENFKELDVLLNAANQGLERVRALQNRFGGAHDTAHLAVVINIHDLEALKNIYHFVDNITMMDVKRFGVIYKRKSTLMDDLFLRALNNDPELNPELHKLIDAKVYKAYKKNNHVPLPLKTTILKDVSDVLDFECELLTRTLNLVSALHIREKAIYKSTLLIMGQADKASMDKRRVLRRIWVKIRKQVVNYKPRNFQKNYENNSRALLTDVKHLVGSKLDDL